MAWQKLARPSRRGQPSDAMEALAREVTDSERRGAPAPAAQPPGNPPHAGEADKKKARRSSEPL
jgi:hypothetical protein